MGLVEVDLSVLQEMNEKEMVKELQMPPPDFDELSRIFIPILKTYRWILRLAEWAYGTMIAGLAFIEVNGPRCSLRAQQHSRGASSLFSTSRPSSPPRRVAATASRAPHSPVGCLPSHGVMPR